MWTGRRVEDERLSAAARGSRRGPTDLARLSCMPVTGHRAERRAPELSIGGPLGSAPEQVLSLLCRGSFGASSSCRSPAPHEHDTVGVRRRVRRGRCRGSSTTRRGRPHHLLAGVSDVRTPPTALSFTRCEGADT